MQYKYITEDNLEYRQKYTYSDFGGKEFLDAYLDLRRGTLKELCRQESYKELKYEDLLKILQTTLMEYNDAAIDMRCLLLNELKLLQTENHDRSLLDSALKTFEVRKRLYHFYSENFRPQDEEDYKDYGLYILFSAVMSGNYEKTRNLKYLNALLKCNDILISLYQKRDGLINIPCLAFILNKEINQIQNLCVKKNVEI